MLAAPALAGMFPEVRTVGARATGGSQIAVGYLIGFAVLLFTVGRHPDAGTTLRITAPAGAAKVMP